MKKHLPYQIIVSLLTAVILVMAMTLPAFPGGVVYADETPAAASGGDGVTYEGEGGETAEEEDDESSQKEASATKDTGASSDDAGAGDTGAKEDGKASGSGAELDFTAYGEDEGFCIVPVCAGNNSIDLAEQAGSVSSYKSHRNKNQVWKIHRSGKYYYFESLSNGNRVIQGSNNPAAGTRLRADRKFDGSDDQLFRLEEAGDGTYYIRSKVNENLVWDIAQVSKAGTLMQKK